MERVESDGAPGALTLMRERPLILGARVHPYGKVSRTGGTREGVGLIATAGFAIGAILFAEYASYEASTVLATGAIAAMYWSQDRRHECGWQGNPLRLLLPLFAIFQLCGWLRCFLHISSGDWLDYTWRWAGYSPEFGIEGCAKYMVRHLWYFVGLHVGFRMCQSPSVVRRGDARTALLFCSPVLIAAMVGFYLTYGKEAQFSALVLYVTTNIMRLWRVSVLIITYVALSARSNTERIAAWCLSILTMALAVAVVLETQMRFMVLQQVAALGLVWLYTARRKMRPGNILAATVAAVAGLAIFSAVTDIKTKATVEPMQPTMAKAANIADALLYRGASFHAESAIAHRESLSVLFVEKRDVLIKEFLSGIPMSGLLTNRLVLNDVAFDMLFHWTNTGASDESSYFVGALTALRFGFGVYTSVLAALVFGYLHGRGCRMVMERRLEWNWLAVHAVYLPVILHGLQKSDLLGIPVNLAIYVGALHMLKAKRST